MVVLYFSSGYQRAVSPELTAVTAAAAEWQAPIFDVDLRRSADSQGSGTTPADWDAYVTETQDALRTLSTETGGFTAFTDADLEQMLTRIRGAG